ncbi:hypothetical protein TI04_11035 [Achromatium sp. WMS2]|nr:hypothetical protein TI04_11035 [Achromatium sp. WMS2]
MNIAETIYQHVKIMPPTEALEVLQFISFIETKNRTLDNIQPENDILEFIQTCPAAKTRSDIEINEAFQSLRDEWV